jgi:ATP-dependent Clp protease ATP-binding subunit ClpX
LRKGGVYPCVNGDTPSEVLADFIESLNADGLDKSSLLLIGNTGIGKTALATNIAKFLDNPFISFAAPDLVPEGYEGLHIKTVLMRLYEKAGKNLEKAQRGIIFIDEIDKIKKVNDPSLLNAQDSILTCLNGADFYLYVEEKNGGKLFDEQDDTSIKSIVFNTSHITFICAGAFVELFNNDKEIGFESKKGIVNDPKSKAELIKKLENYGMKRELLGRLPNISILNELTISTYKKILLSEMGYLTFYKWLFVQNEIELNANLELLAEYIADESTKRKLGARAAKQILDEIFKPIIAKILFEQYNEVIIEDNIVSDNKAYKLIKKETAEK